MATWQIIALAWGMCCIGFVLGLFWTSWITHQKLLDLDYTWRRRYEQKGCPECLERAKIKADFEADCG